MADLTTNKSYNYYWQSAKFKDLVFSGSLISQFVNDKGYVTSSVAVSASYALTASYVKNAVSASYFSGSVKDAISASYAATSSYSLNPTVSGSINNVDYIDFNTGSAVPSWKSGRIFWDNTEGCLAVYNAEADITLQVGQENWTRVFNDTGVTIANGAAVRIVGTHGDHPEVVLAQSIQVSGSANLVNQILGVATHAIENNSFGYITTQGLVRGLNTNAFNDGDTLYVSSSAGQLTNIVLPAPYEIIPVAQVVKASPGASGIIYVAVQQPVDFADLSSVYISGSYSGGDIWTYNAPNKRWEHTNQLSGSYGLTGSLTATSFTGSLQGTATTASYVLNAVSSSFTTTASYALSASFAPDTTFPYTGSAIVTGSMTLTGSLQVAVPSTAGVASELARFKPTDSTSFLQIINYSTTQGAFVPTIRTLHSASSTNVGLQLIAQIGNDGATNTNPAMTFLVMSQSAAVGQIRNRTLFTWENNNTSSMALTTVGLAIGTNLLRPSASLHINNTSSFNSFLVEDDTRPDSSPFVIDSIGRVGIGKTSPSASLDITGSVLITGSLNISSGITGSLQGTATTSSFVNTLNQNVIITGSLAIGTGSIGNGENNLLLGPAPAGGTGEGGQIALLSVGGTYTSSSFIDNYQNQLRILSGPGATSNAGILAIDLGTKGAKFEGAVTASAYSGLPNDYLYVTRNIDQTIVSGNWANRDIIFNNTVVSKGISYNTSTGLASLTGGKVYRITSRLAWNAAAVYLFQFACYNSSNTILGPTIEMVQSTNSSNNISDGTLDFIYAPVSNVDIKIRTTANTTALSGEFVRGDLNTQFIIQQIA